MWSQTYDPVGGSLQLSALVAMLPVFVVLILLGVLRKPAWMSAMAGFVTAFITSITIFHMPASLALSSSLYGAANGLMPIGWFVFTAILLYKVTVDTGKFEIIMLQRVTNLPMDALSADVGRMCAPLALILPSYLMLVMGGVAGLRAALPAAITCGVAFAGMQFLISNYVGPNLAALLSAITAMCAMLLLLKFWTPEGDEKRLPSRHTPGEIFLAWSPYLLLVIFVLAWGNASTKAILDRVTVIIPWPNLHNLITRMPPITAQPTPYAAPYTFNWLSAAGTSCMFAVLATTLVLKVSPARLGGLIVATAKQLVLPLVTIMCVVGLAFLMNYSGQTATLGLVIAATGVTFPFFSTMLGWMG